MTCNMYRHNVIGFPPAPAAPVHFELIADETIREFKRNGWAFSKRDLLERYWGTSEYRIIATHFAVMFSNEAAQS